MLIDVHQTDAQGNVFTLRQELRIMPGLTVPAGFSSDGASVPRFFWRLVFPPGDQKALRAAFVHDWLYRTHPEGWTREAADMLFLKLLLKEGMPKFRAYLAWLGVRIFGGAAWNAGGANCANTRTDTDGHGPTRTGAEGEATGEAAETDELVLDCYGWPMVRHKKEVHHE